MFNLAYRPASYRDDRASDNPDRDSDEIEIALIEMSSTLGDVIAIRAREADGLIRYSVADENERPYDISPEVSERPLKMAALIALIDTADDGDDGAFGVGVFEKFLEYNAQGGADPGELLGFIQVQSDFYPELGAYYEKRAQDWVARRLQAAD